MTVISLDDDQYELRSLLNAILGIMRKHNPNKRYGCIHDCVMSFATGAIFAGNLVAGGQSAQESFVIQMKLISDGYHVLGNTIALDRGYSSLHNVTVASDVGLLQNGCITVTACPIKAIDAKHPSGESNFHISPDGYASAYYASYLLRNNTRMNINCYRNGSGKLVHMQTAHSESAPFVWDWEHLGVDSPPPQLTAS